MKRREFLRYSAAMGAGALLPGRSAAGLPAAEPGAGVPVGAMVLPESPGFKTKHLVNVIYGAGARKKEVMDPAMAPNLVAIAKEGTLFTEDFGETANLHGFMYTEVLTGRDAPSQQPRFPTWAQYVRKKT
ncbi:MAG: twin-arginine translocation signal domain-containing protein, partial [Acidobacteria bacterium]|nr:twin-arginine translocation signal domain-containing protein [Acidobacteriota bacterium]